MNERIFDMARQKGATDEHGNRAEGVFCFTKDELAKFAELIVRECANVAADHDALDIYEEIREHFGVEE